MTKCTLCVDRIYDDKLAEADRKPACVKACPTGARLFGDVKDPVGRDGKLTAAGPCNADVDRFPTWFATYDNVLVTRDGKGARKPGTVMLSGDLPHSASTG